MTLKSRSITLVGITQVILAASFVIWLFFIPRTGDVFAWPVTPIPTAMFIGAGFMVRTMIGYFLFREKYWYRLRWQSWGNYAFLAIILLATFWHVDEMNWKSNILVAHIWVIAYTVEPLILPLMEPRRPARSEPFPETEKLGPVKPGLKRTAAAGMIVSVLMGGLMVINPQFLDTRWPWPLDPFNARVMAGFFGLAAAWCLYIYFHDDWAEVRLNTLGLAVFAAAQFVAWLINYGSFDPARNNRLIYGVGFGSFAVLLVYYFWTHERNSRVRPFWGLDKITRNNPDR